MFGTGIIATPTGAHTVCLGAIERLVTRKLYDEVRCGFAKIGLAVHITHFVTNLANVKFVLQSAFNQCSK